uniref:Uncharacterized protein n=1 Tax=Ostreococcus tauri TaxID=70448 RepID=S5MGT0_OSTTA|nr:hypothetical protein OtMtg00250 [Ostreococcus tauri]AGR42804.1 hypothetical protein OtMtg00390 [Ostreococcus tauri]AGR42833.1 hypothetical protein OtMtg00250 [Ostreococcus tauri]AGR42847.1 hypothetical protein OtMtg00390 [Ostreococcus tauri]AGR43005.1 hypothetical protein OtMtg00250 [Ostreococcus tauri]
MRKFFFIFCFREQNILYILSACVVVHFRDILPLYILKMVYERYTRVLLVSRTCRRTSPLKWFQCISSRAVTLSVCTILTDKNINLILHSIKIGRKSDDRKNFPYCRGNTLLYTQFILIDCKPKTVQHPC